MTCADRGREDQSDQFPIRQLTGCSITIDRADLPLLLNAAASCGLSVVVEGAGAAVGEVHMKNEYMSFDGIKVRTEASGGHD